MARLHIHKINVQCRMHCTHQQHLRHVLQQVDKLAVAKVTRGEPLPKRPLVLGHEAVERDLVARQAVEHCLNSKLTLSPRVLLWSSRKHIFRYCSLFRYMVMVRVHKAHIKIYTNLY